MSGLYYEYRQWLYDNYTSRGVITNITFEKWEKLKKRRIKNKQFQSRRNHLKE